MSRVTAISKTLRKWLLVWRWQARRRCHGSIDVCQYQDRPNDNHGMERFQERDL